MYLDVIHRHVIEFQFTWIGIVDTPSITELQWNLLHSKHIILHYLDYFQIFVICHLTFLSNAIQLVEPPQKTEHRDRR